MAGGAHPVSSEPRLFANREDASAEGREEVGDCRVTGAQDCGRGKALGKFSHKRCFVLFHQKICQEMANFWQLQDAVRELTNICPLFICEQVKKCTEVCRRSHF